MWHLVYYGMALFNGAVLLCSLYALMDFTDPMAGDDVKEN